MLGPVEIVDEVDSTNRVLIDRARAGAPHGAVLVADHQTAGRGRLGRTWEAAPGEALLASVLLRLTLPPSQAYLLTFAAGLAARDACRSMGAEGIGLKWPNDLVVDVAGTSRKLAGLLAESVVGGGALEAVVVGMGLNLAAVGTTAPDRIGLVELTDRPIVRDEVLAAWLPELERRCAQVEAGDRAGLLTDYRAASATIGRNVRVDLGGELMEGRAVDVDEDGHLWLEVAGGRQRVAAGDVVHLRAV